MFSARRCCTLLLVLMLLTPAAALAQAGELPVGSTATGSASTSQPAVFTFSAGSAGFLTVVVRAVGETDLLIVLADTTGQPLPEGRSDQDLMGDTGAEQAVFTIPRAGDYQVRVEAFSGGGDFRIMASWIPYADAEQTADPDGNPDAAAALTPGTPAQDSIDPAAGDAWDWFKVTAESGGIITVATEGEGDLQIEVFAEGAYGEALERSDQDMQGSRGNESLTVRAEAGQTFYFRVSPVFSSTDRITYTIRAGIM